jgi:hypothetical protein
MGAKEKEVGREEKEVEEAQKGVGRTTSSDMPHPPGEDPPGLDPQGLEPEKKPVPIDPAEANIILDAIFTRGVYEEEVDLPRGHKCVFATRSTKQAKEILARLEGDNPTRMPRYNQLYGLYCLTASLGSMDGKMMPEPFDEKIKIIDQWAGPLADILIGELVKFDDKVAAAYTAEHAKN